LEKGRCEEIEKFPFTLPSPARGEGELFEIKKNFLPLDGGGMGGGEIRDFFTPSGGWGDIPSLISNSERLAES
jgi:hypothetical protein